MFANPYISPRTTAPLSIHPPRRIPPHHPVKLCPLLLLAATVPPHAQAQEASGLINTLPEVTIQTASVPTLDNAQYAHRPSITYDEAEINTAHERTVESLLQGEPGIAIVKNDGEGVSNLHLRGAGGQGLLSLDGIPILNSLPGISNINAVLPEGLQSIAVDRGFAPASQGFAALGGAIRMNSRKATDDSADLRVEGGSFGSLKETLRGTQAGDRGGIAVMANRTDVFEGTWVAPRHQGNPERDRSRSTQALSRADWSITDTLHWDGSLLYRQTWNAWDRIGLFKNTLSKVDDPNAFFNEEAWLVQNSLTARLSDRWLSRLQLGYTTTRNDIQTSGLYLGYTTDLYLSRLENDHRIWQGMGHDALHLIWGAEGRHESAQGPSYTVTGPGQFAPGASVSEQRNQQLGFIETRWTYGPWSGDLGARHEAYDRFADQNLLHAGLALQVLPTLTLKANGGNGFRIPSYAERLFPLVGKLGLKPERGTGGDLGFEWQPIKPLALNLTGFYHAYDDMIQMTWNPAFSPGLPCAGECLFNIAEARVLGLESRNEYRFNDRWMGGVAYTYNDSRNLGYGGRIPFEALNTVRVFGEWRPLVPVSLWMEGIYRDRTYNDIGNTVSIPDNIRINARLDYRFNDRLKFYIRGENLNDNKTPYIISLNQTGLAVYGGVMLEIQ